MLVGADGAALSKRLGSLSISDMRDQGYEPIAITSHLGRIGTGPAGGRNLRPGAGRSFVFSKMGRSRALRLRRIWAAATAARSTQPGATRPRWKKNASGPSGPRSNLQLIAKCEKRYQSAALQIRDVMRNVFAAPARSVVAAADWWTA